MEREAFDRLLVQHLPAALRMAVKLTGDPHAAEDVVHDAVVRAARAWHGFRGDAQFSTWWLAIVINVWRDRLRRKNRGARPLDAEVPAAGAAPLDCAVANELAVRVAAAVSALPPRQREVVVLVTYQGLGIAEAAAVLGVNEGNVRTNLSLGRKTLKEKIGPIPMTKMPDSSADQPDAAGDAALDRLLAAADWSAPDAAATARLAAVLARERSWRIGWAIAGAAAAAAVLIVFGRPVFQGSSADGTAVADRSADLAMKYPKSAPTTAEPPPDVALAVRPPLVRPANDYERLILSGPPVRRPPRSTVPVRSTTARPGIPSEAAEPPRAAVATAADPRAAMRAALARPPGGPPDTAGAASFAAVARPSDWPLLRGVLLRPTLTATVWPAVLARGDADSVELLLDAVLDSQTRPDALDAVRRGPMPPTDLLLARLSGPLVDRRLAAAKVLGLACDSAMLPKLADLACSGVSRSEALAVLLSCRSPAARQLVAQIDPDNALAGQADAVRRRINHLFL